MNRIPDILDDLRAGRLIVLVDDEKRENEGDLVCAAQHVTADLVNFMVHQGRGLLCLALTGLICDRLELAPQSLVNTALHGTAFTVSIDADARFGVSTGVSSSDRATTIRVTLADDTRPTDLRRPGHIHPLRAREGGVLVRAGQTEGSVDLCRLAGLKPAAVIIEVMNGDGSMARLPDLKKLCATHKIKMCSVADIIHYRLQRENLVQRIETVPFESRWGRFTLIAYHSAVDLLPHIALVCGDVGQQRGDGSPIPIQDPVLVRMHSQNLLGDVFGNVRDPSDQTLQASMQAIQQAGRGALVYLRHEAMGSGLLKRLQTLHLPEGHASADADRPQLGHDASDHQEPSDSIDDNRPAIKRDYGIGSQILRDLGIRKLKLLTNHPIHPAALEGFGLSITQFVAVPGANPHSP